MSRTRALLRNATVSGLLRRRSVAGIAEPVRSPIGRSQPSSGYSSRLPHFFRRVKEHDLSPPSLSFSTSSSSESVSKLGFVGWYMGMIRSRPILTKSVTSSLIYAAADLSSQTIVHLTSKEPEDYDFVRTSRMAGYGMVVLGTTLHFWFNFMSKLFPKQDMASTLKKMFMGQAIYGPIMTVAFFSLNAALQGENSTEIGARLKRDLVPTLINGLMYWPVCDFITYRFIPVHLQPLMSNCFSYLWTIYMTYMASLEKVNSKTQLIQ